MHPTETHRLPCVLSTQDLRDKSEQLAFSCRTQERLDEQLEALRARQKETREAIRNEVLNQRTLSREIESKTDFRTVECDAIRILERNLVALRRRDTMAIISVRAMNPDERQILLTEAEHSLDPKVIAAIDDFERQMREPEGDSGDDPVEG